MQSSKSSSGSLVMDQLASVSPSPLDAAINPRPPRSVDRSELSSKTVPTHERQQQLGNDQGEVKMSREEKSEAEELEVLKQKFAHGIEERGQQGRIQILEDEMAKAKESERKMLESLVSQTMQLEQAKRELEEAKLEIRNLQEGNRGFKQVGSVSGRNLERFLEKPAASGSTQSPEEILKLQRELRLALEAEEKSKEAMDSLALALSEVTTEMNQLKKQLSVRESELERFRVEADHSNSMLKATEDKFRIVLAEVERLRLEADESAANWSAKEKGFISCMKVSEEEAARVMQENNGLLESQKIAREENSRLRDIMKQALNEASVVKEALEIARRENYQLKDHLSEKEDSLETIKQEYECLKVSEAAALDSVKELKNLFAAPSTTETSRSVRSADFGSSTKPAAMEKHGTGKNLVAKFPSERRSNDVGIQNGLKIPRARSGSLQGSLSRRVAPSRKDCLYGSLGCVSDTTIHSFRRLKNGEAQNSDDIDHTERIHLEGINNGSDSATKDRKKKILRKFW